MEFDERLIPQLNIITLGHVDHGKSTLTEALSGKWPAVHTEEKLRGITLRLGYADVTVYRCDCGFTVQKKCLTCLKECEPVRTFSIIDAPGHETLMATVLSGSSLADGALFLIAANEGIQAQTKEHLAVLEIAGIKNIVIVQSKIDLVSEEQALKNYEEIREFVKGTVAENAPIIPVSAQQGVNIDILLEAIEKNIPTPKRDPNAEPLFLAARSFDVNKPGTKIDDLKGGVLGGSIVKGRLKLGEEIEIRPGIKRGEKWSPVKTSIHGLKKAGYDLEEAGPGGLLGLCTGLDPSLTKSDSMAGSVVGRPGSLPETRNELKLKINLMDRIITDVKPVVHGEPLMITVGVSKSVGLVTSCGKNVSVKLKLPVCCETGERVAVSRLVNDRWRLIGWGEVL
ncbi:MAG: translation initiation factor IF-2 subunit gamma [Candidatus Micrarchaeota archaeon]|nr:translation initiation factor IF-2 subunit gamma [Candidatus Micrarchaeota archaeon]